MGTVFLHRESSIMNWSFVFLAQHEDPEVGSVLQQLIIRTFSSKKNFEKIRNAEMGIR